MINFVARSLRSIVVLLMVTAVCSANAGDSPRRKPGWGRAIADIIHDIQVIAAAQKKDMDKRRHCTQDTLNKMLARYPGYRIMVINSAGWYEMSGAGVVMVDHFSCKLLSGSMDFEIISISPDEDVTIVNRGDGGYENWAFGGARWDRNDKTVHFNALHYALTNVRTNKVLDHYAGQSIQAYDADKTNLFHQWQLGTADYSGSTRYVFIRNIQTGMVLDHYAGTQIAAYNSDFSNPYHQWEVFYFTDGSRGFKNRATGRVLEHVSGQRIDAIDSDIYDPARRWYPTVMN